MEDIICNLGLTFEQTRILFSFQYHITVADINEESNNAIKLRKISWLTEWKAGVENFLNNLLEKSNRDESSFCLFTNYHSLIEQIKKIKKYSNFTSQFHLILIEVAFFRPYFPLGLKIDSEFYGLKYFSEEKIKNKLEFFTSSIGLNFDYIEVFNSPLWKSIINKDSKRFVLNNHDCLIEDAILNLTAKFDVAHISAFLNPGRDNQPTVASSLAALGGGVIAVDSYEIIEDIKTAAGGYAILLVSEGTVTGLGVLFSVSSQLLLAQAAKLDVVFDKIVLKYQSNYCLAKKIIKYLRKNLFDFEESLLLWRENEESNKERIDNLARSIEYTKYLIKRCENLYLDAIKRRYARLPVMLDVFYAEALDNGRKPDFIKSHTLDISGGGVRFLANKKYTNGTILHLKLLIPSLKNCEEIAAFGRVVRSSDADIANLANVALEFTNINSNRI